MSIFKKNNGSKDSTALTVHNYFGKTAGDEYAADVVVSGRNHAVALFRPPILLDQSGNSQPGVDADLVAGYMVQTISSLADVDLGPVQCHWRGRVGRFAVAEMEIATWSQSLTIVQPVQVISQQVEVVMAMYQDAVAEKARQMHKAHPDLEEPNKRLSRAAKLLEKLRDDDHPHLTPAEHLFLVAQISRARVMNPLLPLPVGGEEPVIGESTTVHADTGRLPAGG